MNATASLFDWSVSVSVWFATTWISCLVRTVHARSGVKRESRPPALIGFGVPIVKLARYVPGAHGPSHTLTITFAAGSSPTLRTTTVRFPRTVEPEGVPPENTMSVASTAKSGCPR